MSTYAITGATGNTGKPIALGLLDKGHAVRVVSRDAAKAKPLTDRGAVLFEGDTRDAALLARAFEGATAAYLMLPFDAQAPDYTAMQEAHATAMARAAGSSRLPRAVTLSSVGAHLAEGAGVVQGLQRLEAALNAVEGLSVLHLRASYFLENTLGQAGAVRHMGAMGSPVRADLAIPMVATRDIAACALRRLLALDFSGRNVQYLLGAADYTYQQVASVYGRAIGKPELAYHQVSQDQAKPMMMSMGMGESVVDRLGEFVLALNDGRARPTRPRDAGSTTPTTLDDFAAVFKGVYESQAGAAH
jgi:uncharacterized protein YbjT (DUF2867 family)